MRSKKSSKKKNKKRIGAPNFLLVLGIFFVMLSGSLLTVFINNNFRYDPSLEKKLEMKTLPSEVKQNLINSAPSVDFRVPVLMYHYVEYVPDEKDKTRESLNINPYIFELQIKTLKEAGYTFMTASQLGKVLDGVAKMPQKPVLITFDDGHRDFYTDVFPILKKYNARATAYIIPGFLGGTDFMDKYQVQEIANSSFVEVGAHTMHHVYLREMPLKEAQREIDESKVILQTEFNIPVFSFAYPYGAFDQQAIDIVKDAGFTTAVSTLPGITVNNEDRYFIERIRPGARTGKSLINFLENYKTPSALPTAE